MAIKVQVTPTPSKRKAELDDSLVLNVIKQYFKYAGVAIVVWGLGYLWFSPAWILLGLVIVVWQEKNSMLLNKRIDTAQTKSSKTEKDAILARIEDLPSWVFFPDVERVDWVNRMIVQVWPFVGVFVQELLITNVQQIIQDSSTIMGSFKFQKIDIGDIPPRIGGVKVYTEKVKRDEIYLDLDVIFSSDCDIEVMLKGVKAGIKELQFHGSLRLIFKPLLGQPPFFGGISVFFLTIPTILFNLTNLANALNLPGLSEMLHTIIKEQIASLMVLPNRIEIQIVEGPEPANLKNPMPAGVLRVHVIEAKELVIADFSLLGKGSSDPYAVVKVGAVKFKTPVIRKTLQPRWNSVFEYIIYEKDGQYMDIKVKDFDTGSKSDKLGVLTIDLSPVADKGCVDGWYPLEQIKAGKIHLKLVWLNLSKEAAILNKILGVNKFERNSMKENELSSCILMVILDSARQLPRSKKLLEPSPYVILSVGQTISTSEVLIDATDPRWVQSFRFLVQDPNFQTLDLKVMDKKQDKQIGEMSYSLKNLLTAPDMVDDRFFQLKNCDNNSEISLRLMLRVLTTEKYNEYEILMNQPVPLPTETIPKTTDAQPATSCSPNTVIHQNNSPTEKNAKPSLDKEQGLSSRAYAAKSHPLPASTQLILPAKSASFESVTDLRRRKDSSTGMGACRMGKIQVTLKYSMQRGKLIVVIHKCIGLVANGKDNFSNPYVKLYLLPDKSNKKKTKVVENNLNPVFGETFKFSVTPQDLHLHQLEIMVKNDTGVFSSSQHNFGVLQISLAHMNITQSTTEWYDLAPQMVPKKPELMSDV